MNQNLNWTKIRNINLINQIKDKKEHLKFLENLFLKLSEIY